MPRSAPPEARSFRLGLAAIAAVTLWRVALLPFDATDLFVDESQYWFWGQELAWGYYSKPPLIGWILRAATEIGSDDRFWIRLPLPLIHAGTAVLLAFAGRRLFGGRIGGLAGAGFATLPGVAVGSLLVSTDTPMLFCFALALLAFVALGERRSAAWALAMGAAIGTGLLAKYAMVYFPLCAALAAALLPDRRIAWRDAGLAAALALAIVAPNLAWNASHDFATLQHTADNTDWRDAGLRPGALLAFWGGQFAVAGPVLFAAYLAGLGRLRAIPPARFLAAMSLPVFVLVSVQALRSGANANWAAAGHLGAVLLGIAVLAPRRRLLALSFAINLAVSLALPIAATQAARWHAPGGNLVLARYVGQGAVSRRAAAIAEAEGLDTLVSDSRTLLADFFYTLRDSRLAIHAAPVEGFPPHHYALAHALPPGPGAVLFVSRDAEGPDCPVAGVTPELVASWRPEEGFVTDTIYAHRVPRRCWYPGPG